MQPLDKLEEDYYRAANALVEHRNAHGFLPGAQVKTQPRFGDTPKFGVIAPYGEDWATAGHYAVPVLLENGHRQPWPMSQLEILVAGYPEEEGDDEAGKP